MWRGGRSVYADLLGKVQEWGFVKVLDKRGSRVYKLLGTFVLVGSIYDRGTSVG